MKRLAHLFTVVAVACLSACTGPTNAPEKKPVFIQLNEKGELAAFPIPCIAWGKEAADVIAWEKPYKSKLITEEKDKMVFKTTEQQELNPVREYTFSDKRLSSSIVSLKAHLLFVDEQCTALREGTEKLLSEKGFVAQKDLNKNTPFAYYNKELQTLIIIATLAVNEQVLIFYNQYTPKNEESKPDHFVPIVHLDESGQLKAIPYPFVAFSQGRKEIQKWEKEHGSTFRKTSDATAEGTVSDSYKTNDPDKRNELRIYTIGDKGNGKLISALITLDEKLVFDLSAEKSTLTDHFLRLMQDEGYRLISKEEEPLFSFVSDKMMISILHLANANVASISYMPSGSEPVVPTKEGYDLLMPSFAFGSSFASDGPIAQWESERGYVAEYHEDLDWGNYLLAVPKVGSEGPTMPYRVGSISYYPEYKEKYEPTDVIYSESVVSFHDDLAVDGAEIKEIMKENNFVPLEGGENEYINKEKNAYIQVKKSSFSNRTELYVFPLDKTTSHDKLRKEAARIARLRARNVYF